MDTNRILILGGGFGGLEAAVRLREALPESAEVTLIDRSDSFVIGSRNIDVLAGQETPAGVRHSYRPLRERGVHVVQDAILEIDPHSSRVRTERATWSYDYLLVGLGAELAPEATPGFAERGHHFYNPEAAGRLHDKLRTLESGTLVLSIFGAPYRCPPAPFEGVVAIDSVLRELGTRDQIDIVVTVPGSAPLPFSPETSELVQNQLSKRNIEIQTDRQIAGLRPAQTPANDAGDSRTVVEFADGSQMEADLFAGVPLHRPPQVVRDSPLGNGAWAEVDRHTLATSFDNVFAAGDCAAIGDGNVTVPKAGVFAEESARVASEHIAARIQGQEATAEFRGEGACYFQLPSGEVAALRASFFGGPTPQVRLEGPSQALRAEKKEFIAERVERWFGGAGATQ